jgi:hypothetical protein
MVRRYAETWTGETDEFSLEPDHAGMWVKASDYDALAARLADVEKFLQHTGWQQAQDETNALRARLASAKWLLRWIRENTDAAALDEIDDRIDVWLKGATVSASTSGADEHG